MGVSPNPTTRRTARETPDSRRRHQKGPPVVCFLGDARCTPIETVETRTFAGNVISIRLCQLDAFTVPYCIFVVDDGNRNLDGKGMRSTDLGTPLETGPVTITWISVTCGTLCWMLINRYARI